MVRRSFFGFLEGLAACSALLAGVRILQQDGDLSLAEIPAWAGFSDQSQFSHHFKRQVGVTPGQFRRSARIA
jgi:AraC-like DNA-binding protein